MERRLNPSADLWGDCLIDISRNGFAAIFVMTAVAPAEASTPQTSDETPERGRP
jgi:hypothetical protein